MSKTRQPRGAYRSGELARAAGVSADTLRHYESRGLLAKPRRLSNGYRLYSSDALDRVRLIQRALAAGFTLAELTRLLRARAAGAPPCREARALALQRLRDVEKQIDELARFRDGLKTIIGEWDIRLAKSGDRRPARLLESLGLDGGGGLGASSLKGLRFARRLRKNEKR